MYRYLRNLRDWLKISRKGIRSDKLRFLKQKEETKQNKQMETLALNPRGIPPTLKLKERG